MASTLLKAVGFQGEALAIALGVSHAESMRYSDAVGDLALVNEKWGPSIGLFQIRSLRHPEAYGKPDSLRIAEKLRSPSYNAATAFALVAKFGWKQWSVYNSGSYKKYAGQDYEIITGHERAALWNV